MDLVASLCGIFWLAAGLLELNISLSHAKTYGTKPVTYAAWFWLASAAGAFVVAFILSGAA